MLSRRLASLVEAGIAERRPYRAGRDEIVLTEAGLELWPIVHGLMQWGERHLVPDGPVRLFTHAACGTEPAPAEIETRPGPGRPSVVRTDAISVALREPHRLLTPVAA